MIRCLVRCDYPERDIVTETLLDPGSIALPRNTNTEVSPTSTAVIRGATPPIAAQRPIEPRQIQLGDHINNEPSPPWSIRPRQASTPRSSSFAERSHYRTESPTCRAPPGQIAPRPDGMRLIVRSRTVDPRDGSQVGSHSLWTCVDGHGRLWN